MIMTSDIVNVSVHLVLLEVLSNIELVCKCNEESTIELDTVKQIINRYIDATDNKDFMELEDYDCEDFI